MTVPLFGQKPPERDGLLQTALTGIAYFSAAPAGARLVSRQTSTAGNGINRIGLLPAYPSCGVAGLPDWISADVTLTL